ncbi:MAG TPA: hypothetical protein VF132_00120 [Rudaea sp.]
MSDSEPAATPESPRLRQSERASQFAQWSSTLALAVSFLALAVGAYQTRIMQNQARASVWPSLAIDFGYFGSGEKAGFTWDIDNNGVGPARIEWVTLSLDGQPMRNWSDVYAALQVEGLENATLYGISGKVLPPNTNRETTITAIRITDPATARRFFDARDRFAMAICYCSVYDECWVAKWREPRPEPASGCAVPPAIVFKR